MADYAVTVLVFISLLGSTYEYQVVSKAFDLANNQYDSRIATSADGNFCLLYTTVDSVKQMELLKLNGDTLSSIYTFNIRCPATDMIQTAVIGTDTNCIIAGYKKENCDEASSTIGTICIVTTPSQTQFIDTHFLTEIYGIAIRPTDSVIVAIGRSNTNHPGWETFDPTTRASIRQVDTFGDYGRYGKIIFMSDGSMTLFAELIGVFCYCKLNQ